MAEYHPLDVRYKGPSTAYRGSAHKKGKWAKASLDKPAAMSGQPVSRIPKIPKQAAVVQPKAPPARAQHPHWVLRALKWVFRSYFSGTRIIQMIVWIFALVYFFGLGDLIAIFSIFSPTLNSF